MSNKLQEIDKKKSYIIPFRWHDQYKIWFKENKEIWKVIQKYSYLLHWIPDGRNLVLRNNE